MNQIGGDKVEIASVLRTTRLLALVCVLISGELVWAAAEPHRYTWERWEHALTSTRNYGNSYVVRPISRIRNP